VFHSITFHCATDAADHPLRGIFHPLGAAFFSNASYPETLKLLNQTDVSIEPFALAGARQMFRYNYSTGSIDINPTPAPQFLAAVSSEIPRYVQLWNQRFQNISTTNYKVRQLCDVTCSSPANATSERCARRIHRIRRRMVSQEQLHRPPSSACQPCGPIWIRRHQYRTRSTSYNPSALAGIAHAYANT
jgi:hypothetical protein